MTTWNKIITKLFTTTILILFDILILQSQEAIVDMGVETNTSWPTEVSRDMWDTQFTIDISDITTGTVTGAETDGTYIYASEWNSPNFRKYDLLGNLIETFVIAGVERIRDLAYDGQYFYGGRVTDTIYKMDFQNKILVDKIHVSQEVRSLAYNIDLDVFYSNNWNSDIFVFDRLGNTIGQFPVGSFGYLYGLAYDNWSEGGPYLWAASQEPTDSNTLAQYNLITQQETGLYLNLGYLALGNNTGGIFIGEQLIPGTITLGGVIQTHIIYGLELTLASTTCNPPTNFSGYADILDAYLTWSVPEPGYFDIAGYNLYRDDHLINTSLLTSTSFIDAELTPGNYYYQVTAVYNNNQGTFYCESEPTSSIQISILPPSCDPPVNLQATVSGDNITLQWNSPLLNPDQVDGYYIYRDNVQVNSTLITNTNYTDSNLSEGIYSYKVTAIYLDEMGGLYCESDPTNTFVIEVVPPVLTLGGNVFAGTEKMNLGYVEATVIENEQVVDQYQETINDTLGYYFFFPFYTNHYFVQAVAENQSYFAQNYAPTYFGNTLHWEDATPLLLAQNMYNVDINMISLASTSVGSGTISGLVTNQSVTSQITPADKILVFLLNNANSCISYVYTNIEGQFQFNNLQFGHYKILVEIAGKKMNAIPYELTAQTTIIDNIQVIVKETEIVIGIDEHFPSFVDFMSKPYPNPAKSYMYFNLTVTKGAVIKTCIYNTTGRKVLQTDAEVTTGSNEVMLNVSDLHDGMYYLNLDFGKGFVVNKKFVVVK